MRRFDEFSHNIIDSHIHVGWYDNFYFSAQEILNIVSKLKISKCFISSMSGWKKGTEFASNELLNVTKSNPHIFYPLLWVNPLEEYVYEITAKLAKKTFHGLKIHPNADGYHAS
ncbi:MAG: hypothetical protein PF482_08265, partial [Desulfobacteraceae bacterium]|nr:hypothetical protein [Desulfobacteraceae bacterium]